MASERKSGKLWYARWADFKIVRKMYDMDIMVSIARYPPYRYMGSVKKTDVLDFRQLGPSPELHKWRKERQKIDKDPHKCWTEYASRYRDEIGNREFKGKADKQYGYVVGWVKQGLNVCLLCTCKMSQPCHRYLLYSNMRNAHKLPYRGSDVKLNWPFPVDKASDETWEEYAIYVFAKKNRIGVEGQVLLACPHVEMHAAYERLKSKGVFGGDGPYLFLEKTALDSINRDDWKNETPR